MVVRANRETGESFLGCSQFPSCRGTRPLETRQTSPVLGRSRRYKLSTGGTARTIPEVTELLVARAIGRNLTPIQGCLVQLAALIVLVVIVWAFFASGLFLRLAEPVARWYADQVHFGPTPTTSP
jgi:hypothetical protein